MNEWIEWFKPRSQNGKQSTINELTLVLNTAKQKIQNKFSNGINNRISQFTLNIANKKKHILCAKINKKCATENSEIS